ncbi:MAG TPA: DMT family transporter [Telluria sp.]|nr:DMT family transporter [Telluria sp.]
MTVRLTQDRGNLYSIYAMLFAVAMFGLMDASMKGLAAVYPAVQVASMRALASMPLIYAYLAWRGGFRGIFRVRRGMHLLRAALGIIMLSLFAYGLKELSLAETYTIFFVAPGLITGLSVFFLGERVSAARWIAIAVGLAGVVIVLRPTVDGMFTWGGLAVLASAACYAVSNITSRIVARTDRTEHMVFWLMTLMAIGATALAAPGWVAVRPEHAWLIAALAVSGFFGQIAITEAFASGEASVVAPFEYTALAWGVAIDFLVWHALPDRYTLLGAAVIIGSGLYLIRHEQQQTPGEHP